MLLHLIKLITAHGVDVATLELLLKDLGNRDLRQVGRHAQHVRVHDASILIVLHLGREGGIDLFLVGIGL